MSVGLDEVYGNSFIATNETIKFWICIDFGRER